jgi:hypothetical protein
MSTSFYGSLPESTTSDNATSVPIPITTSTTVTRTYVEYTSSPEVGSIESAKKYTKYLDEADLDFEKTFQQQSAGAIVTTATSQIIQSSTTSTTTSTDKQESSTSQSTVVETSTIKKDEKLWDKPLGKFVCFVKSFSR